jgi:DNA-binding SARP family transcriptional activator/pimeloyl-ACP methyl ester carboxylesterase
MDFRILGPLEVRDGDRELRLRGGKERALLALLLVNANRTLALDRIVDGLWGDDVPETAQKMVQIYVSHLRKALTPETLRTRPPGYALVLEPEQLDLDRFEAAVAEARAALEEGRVQQAADGFREALSLWRGAALAEFASEPFAPPEGARLEELHIAALESRIEADLALGQDRAVVSELEALIAQHPLRERLRSQHMLSLYRSGRHAEALASYQAFRRTLSEELGIEPSSSLRELERLILQQDSSLDLATRTEARTGASAPAAGTVMAPEDHVAYARSGDTRIAYQVVGDGALDLVLVHGWVCTFQPGWEYPKLAAFYRRLASFSTLVRFDKRGTGLSDRVSPECLPDLETRMDDVRAVLDAVGSERAVLLGLSEGGSMSTLFAATYPQRTLSLILMGTFPRLMQAPDYPWGVSEDILRRRLALLDEDDWASAATRDWLGRAAPDVVRNADALRWYTSYMRRGASPGASRAMRLMNAGIDIRHVLPTIGVPTLVLHRAHESWRDGSRFMGEHIPGARTVELPGNDHLPWEGDAESVLDEVERFLSGRHDEVQPDRVLATVLVIEADGTEEACDLVRADVARFRGTELSLTTDTLVATFDGPARAIRCASTLLDRARSMGRPARAGLHTGEQELGGELLASIPVSIARGLKNRAEAGEVLVSSTVRDLVAGSRLDFGEPQQEPLRIDGVPGKWRVQVLVA